MQKIKKIMFSDRYGLTKAVLEGRKTMTRRNVPSLPPVSVNGKLRSIETIYMEHGKLVVCCGSDLLLYAPNHCQPKFKVGEVVAVAQPYCEIMPYLADSFYKPAGGFMEEKPGYRNKMFVRGDLMPHKIRITNVRVERLQDISDEDCLREGILEDSPGLQYSFPTEIGYCGQYPFDSPRSAFAALIDKISGKGTWESNPWVFVYEFELQN